MNAEHLNITILQTDIVWEDIDTNLKNLSKTLQEIQTETDLIVLPEMFAIGFSMQPEKFAEQAGGKIQTWMQNQARQKNAIIIGSLIAEDEKKFYNRLFAVQPSGEFASYNKRHLFSFAGEHLRYTAGTETITIDVKGWKIRPLICYDLRFPVWSRNKSDYDVLIYIANWPARRSFAWKTLLTARAIENQAYVAGVNRIGADGNGIEHSGDSLVLNYLGEQISSIQPNVQKWEQIKLNYREMYEFRQKFPALLDADKFSIEL